MAERRITQQSIPTIGAGEIPRIQFSSGSARALEAFSRDMFSLSNSFQDQLDAQAEAEGTVAGALDGADGNFTPRDFMTIRNRAYNKAAIDTFTTTMETQSIAKIQELQTKFGADPERLQQELDAYGRGVSSEVEKTWAPAGAAFRQRLALRAAPVVEAARDTRFKLTRSQADAALLEQEVALGAEIQHVSADLFSENPARSEAAAAQVGALQSEYLKIFEAVDPTTGRPLYSPEERAKAKVGFYENVMEKAALGWFDGQTDKAAAYTRFVEGNFSIKLTQPNSERRFNGDAPAFLKTRLQGQHGASHIDGMQPVMQSRLAAMMSEAPDFVRSGLDILSGKRSSERQRQLWNASDKTGRWVARPGRSRHEHGDAADLGWKGGKFANAPAAVKEWVHANAGSYGLRFPMGHEPWHIETFEARGKRAPQAPDQMIDVRKALPDAAMGRIEAEMRASITFGNQMVDRQRAAEERELKARQEANDFEFANRINPTKDPETGEMAKPLTREEITEGVRLGRITSDAGKALVKGLTVDKPDKSDPAFMRDVERRLYAGENVYQLIIDNPDRLSPSDFSTLLGKNQSQNVNDAGALTKDQQFHFDNVKARLSADTMMGPLDEGRQNRRYMAMDEYRRRVKDGEDPRDVANDVVDRATIDGMGLDRTKLGTLIRPRFSVEIEGQNRVDVAKSFKNLKAMRATGLMRNDEYQNQLKLLNEWKRLQEALDRAPAQVKAKP